MYNLDENVEVRNEDEMVRRFPFPSLPGPPIVVPRKADVCFIFIFKINKKKNIYFLKELVAVVEKLNELALNDSDLDEETDLDDSLKEINCTQDEFINLNNQKRVLPDLLSNQSIHLLDQTQSHEVIFIYLFI